MQRVPVFSFCQFSAILILTTLCAFALQAQVPAVPLVIEPVDEAKLVTLHGNVHPLAQARYDLGAASASVPARRLLLPLNRSAGQEAALAQYMKDVHTLGSATYHQWITPEQFGARFGAADSDIQTVVSWITSKGFQMTRVSKSKTLIEFSGTFGQISEAFHTAIHRYEVNGELHYANATDPQIPEALAGIVRGLSPLHDFHAKPAIRVVGPAHLDPATRKITPDFALTGPNGTFYGVGPEDFATQYDLAPLYAAGINGKGQTIGILNDSNIDVSLDNAYRGLFSLSSNPAQVVIDGGDPGVNSDETEAYLDVEVAGSVAPGATVNLYIALFDTLDDPLILAAQRAIEDDQADVLSISFGNCEANLGAAHNQILSALWQQAAAQGQTVFVSAGDNGSAGCDDPAPPRVAAVQGLAVNGFASTPWDIAIGGTDFYYSDYASGAPSAATLWNSVNDANYGSLKAPLPEQVWSDWFGFNAAPNPIETIYAGSGGVSSIYSKPAWQTGPGVPSDGQRDLPDVSLFAADGANLSAYVICANPGDCTPDSGQIPVSVVGGTSASSPAMAGIMALVDQKYGRQGQANFVLYPLAQQVPSAFHDITLGGNNVPCGQGSLDCVLGTSGTDKGVYTLSGYPAAAAYDLASGLGSVDANVLVSNWSKITFFPTITTLQLSSVTFAHGTPVTLTADVTHSSGSGTPTGSVAILTSSPLPFNQTEGFLPLGSNGSASGSINSLPGGSYQLWASYAGDGLYSGGTSSPVALSVTPEASGMSISATVTGSPFQSGATIPYGDPISLFVQPRGTASGLATATGSVSFILDGQTAGTVPLNVKGIASWVTPAAAGPGPHSVTASYPGDASYNSSQSSPFTYTVNQQASTLSLGPGGVCGSGITCTAYAGDTVPMEVYLEGFGALIPTGTVTVTLGSQSQAVTMSAGGFDKIHDLTGIAEFSNLTAGTYQLAATYSGDANYQAASAGPFTIVVMAPSGPRVATTTTVTEASATVSYPFGTMGGFTVTVTGPSGSNSPPTGAVSVYTNGLGEDIVTLAPSGSNSASGSTGPAAGDYFNLGLNQVTAVYTGDNTHQESVSVPIILNAVEAGMTPDFTIAPAVPQFVVPKGNSANAIINLGSVSGFSGTVSLSCTTSASSLGCSLSPTSVSVNGPAVVTLTVTAASATSSLSPNPAMRGEENLWMLAGSSAVLGCLFLSGFSRKAPKSKASKKGKRRTSHRRALPVLVAFILIFAWTACGGGGQSSHSTTPPPTQTAPPPPNTYSVVVSGTANGTIHNATVIVVLQ
jgi:hypothetical protein